MADARIGKRVLWLVLAGMVVACGADDEDDSAVIACRGVCEALLSCRLHSDRENCESACLRQSRQLSRMSVDAARAYGDCYGVVGCDALSNDSLWRASFPACFSTALFDLPVTPRVRKFCAAHAERYFECGKFYAVDVCEANMVSFKEFVLDEVERCWALSCDDATSCEEGATTL